MQTQKISAISPLYFCCYVLHSKFYIPNNKINIKPIRNIANKIFAIRADTPAKNQKPSTAEITAIIINIKLHPKILIPNLYTF